MRPKTSAAEDFTVEDAEEIFDEVVLEFVVDRRNVGIPLIQT
jgi:hypothetical protein